MSKPKTISFYVQPDVEEFLRLQSDSMSRVINEAMREYIRRKEGEESLEERMQQLESMVAVLWSKG